MIIEYGMLSEDKFYDKAKSFALLPTVNDEYFTMEELIAKTKDFQVDKDGNHVILYTANKDAQHSFIESAKAKDYEVVLLDTMISPHLIQKLEQENSEAKIKFTRVDAGHIDNLIKKEEDIESKLSDEEKEKLKPLLEETINDKNYTVLLESRAVDSEPFIITVPEFMRRMKEMSAMGGGGMMGMGNMPDMYQVVVNTNHPLVSNILSADEDKQKSLIGQALDLAKLSQNLLHGEELTNFVKRSYEMIK